MPLQGTFDVVDFSEVARLLARLQLTGKLHVRVSNLAANLLFDKGALIGADCTDRHPAASAGDVRGRLEEICFKMLETDRGTFEFHLGDTSSFGSASHDVETVLGRARQRL